MPDAQRDHSAEFGVGRRGGEVGAKRDACPARDGEERRVQRVRRAADQRRGRRVGQADGSVHGQRQELQVPAQAEKRFAPADAPGAARRPKAPRRSAVRRRSAGKRRSEWEWRSDKTAPPRSLSAAMPCASLPSPLLLAVFPNGREIYFRLDGGRGIMEKNNNICRNCGGQKWKSRKR